MTGNLPTHTPHARTAMAPPVEVFPPFQLPARVMVTPDGKRRKGSQIRLAEDCELREMVQWKCHPDGKGRVRCEEVVRLFRR